MRAWVTAALAIVVIGLGCSTACAQRRPAERTVVCRQGVLRWQDDGSEVALFGVNYYPPFAINYQDLGKVGADREAVIRQDVAHFARLGLDLVRLHVWDREISDRDGDLLDNEHLRLLDFLLDQCKRNGIYAVLTPIAWWQTDERTDGFSTHFPMQQMTTDARAWEAQRRYLAQFVRHRNHYTGVAYGDDPCIAAFELINEPIYPADITDARITAYIDALTGAIREAGCAKPVFYNGWGGHLAAVAQSRADGCTFGWYPTGLVAGHALRDNFLPRVADYPDMRGPALGGKARGVYEFDAADVAEGYIYPAMARSFRAGGAQFAAQFQYDPLPLAPFNAGWQTHYLSLVYTPSKALSFLIAADAFHRLPRLHRYRAYPANSRFGEYRVSYREGLSERVGPTAFLYSASTSSRPPAPARLERIAGCGSSPVAAYDGTGAYFLDRLAPGAWRLEVHPDAVWVTDPFAPTSVGREVARVYWRSRSMTLALPDLGPAFTVRTVGGRSSHALAGRFRVTPGVYLLTRRSSAAPPAGWHGPAFVAPPEVPNLPVRVWHDPPRRWVAGRALPVEATVAAPGEPSVSVRFTSSTSSTPSTTFPLRRVAAYRYAGTIPAASLRPGALRCQILVGGEVAPRSFPGGGWASAAGPEPSTGTIFAASAGTAVPPLAVGGASGQTGESALADLPGGGRAVRLSATGFGEGQSAGGIRLKATPPAAGDWATLVVRARALRPDTTAAEVGLVQDDGQAFGTVVPLSATWQDVRVPLDALRPLWSTTAPRLDLKRVSEVSLVFGSWLYGAAGARPHAFEVERIWLEPRPAWWTVEVAAPDAPVPLLTAETGLRLDGVPAAVTQVGGREAQALRIAVPGFGPPPSSTSARANVRDALAPWDGLLASRPGLRIRVRSGEPGTTAVELVVLERDGAPWGTVVTLTPEWRDVIIPWRDLRFFAHWAHPANRGRPGDRFHPADLADLNLCFGAWLFPGRAGERHAVEIEGVWLQ